MLNENLPTDPVSEFKSWLEHARLNAGVPNSHAMSLCTVSMVDGIAYPSNRMVLLKGLDTEQGYVVFYTNYHSRKGQELQENPRASAVLHWDNLGQQVRLEGQITKCTEQESDEYFASRDRDSRVGAWVSEQSQPVASREDLMKKLDNMNTKFGTAGDDIPRPPHWGGYRIWIDRLELWCEGPHRIHDRAIWQRNITLEDNKASAGAWTATRLQP